MAIWGFHSHENSNAQDLIKCIKQKQMSAKAAESVICDILDNYLQSAQDQWWQDCCCETLIGVVCFCILNNIRIRRGLVIRTETMVSLLLGNKEYLKQWSNSSKREQALKKERKILLKGFAHVL